ncbi:uncharacterized protein LOC121726933 [Aricia agestis]|uniref:uncharacterized protein LOC121726933 n=1 Tax=Aricia agestis TaxID=91739 RepID=UPI001C20385E|nr:uncharacterized protein LOC121726933 [Aricia agestis]
MVDKMPTKSRKFDDLFKIIRKSAQIIGTHPKCERNKIWKAKVVIGNVFVFLSFMFILNSVVVHDFPAKNYDEVIKNGIMLTVALMTFTKYNILIYHRKSFGELIDTMDQDVIDAENFPPDEKEIVDAYIQKKIGVSRLWFVCATITCSAFPVKSFTLMFYYAIRKNFKFIPIFDFHLPTILNNSKGTPSVFALMQSVEIGFDTCALISCLGFDALAPIFMLHCCAELDLLRHRLIKAFTTETDPRKILEVLRRINVRLQATYRFIAIIQKIFMILYEILMKITVLMVSFSAFQVVKALSKKETPLEFTFFFFATGSQFLLPSYYSDLLMDTGEEFRMSIYTCGWEMNPDIKIRKTIQFMLTRTIRPIVLKTLFVPVCLDTFAEVCRQCYTIYNILMAVE